MADSPQDDEKPKGDGAADTASDPEADKKFLDLARERFRASSDAWKDIRTAAEEDLRFLIGDQWPAELKRARELDERPVPVINRLPTFCRQLTNDQRQNRPGLKVDPVGDDADIETAEIKQGLLRHIEVKSNADLAYDTAFASAVHGSFGWWRARTGYCDPMSFDQELLLDPIDNPFLVYPGPFKLPDGSDMPYGFVIEDLLEEEFKEQFPNAQTSSADEFKSIGDDAPLWRTEKTIRIAEYLYKDFKEIEIVQLSDQNATVIDKAELVEHPDGGFVTKDGKQAFPSGTTIVQTRKTKVSTVKWAKISGLEVLERGETVFDLWIPLFPALGEKFNVAGEIIIKGLVRDAKDPQRNLNYWKACETETISLAPRTPWVAAEGQIEGYEEIWETAHSKNHAVLPYVPFSLDGTPCPPPSRQAFEPPVTAITNAGMAAENDIKAVTGIYDAGLGRNVSDQSGIAINSLNKQGQTSNFHFVDNLHRTMRHCGRVLMRAIPKVYDNARMERILREDGTREVVPLNQAFEKNGQTKTYDMTKGDYDVVIDTGPSFETKRQEGSAAMLELSKSMPQINQVAGDLVVKAQDMPYADEIAKRIKKTLPPGVADDDEGNQQLPSSVTAEIKKMQGMIDGLTKANNDLHTAIDTKKLELDSNERIKMRELDIKERAVQVQAELGIAQISSKEGLKLLEIQVGQISDHLGMQFDAAQAQSAQDAAAAQNDQQAASGAQPQNNSQPAGPSGAAPSNPTGGAPPGSSMEQP